MKKYGVLDFSKTLFGSKHSPGSKRFIWFGTVDTWPPHIAPGIISEHGSMDEALQVCLKIRKKFDGKD